MNSFEKPFLAKSHFWPKSQFWPKSHFWSKSYFWSKIQIYLLFIEGSWFVLWTWGTNSKTMWWYALVEHWSIVSSRRNFWSKNLWHRHSIFIRTVRSKRLLSALLNWFELVYGQLCQSNMHRILIFAQTSQEGIECTKAKE